MHYRNGRPANVGDLVVGRCYNTSHLVAGTLLSVTPGQDSCSALVGFLQLRLAGNPDTSGQLVKFMGTQQHGYGGDFAHTYYLQDYTECKNLLHADDVMHYGGMLEQIVLSQPPLKVDSFSDN